MDDLEEGWTAHKAPSGHTYYYNAATKKSTYQKPVRSAAVPQPPPPPPILGQDAPSDRTTQQSSAMLNSEVDQILKSQRDSNADRPKYKESIITARPWLFVTTKQGRVFYHNPETGDSFWHLPDSIADAVEAWQRAGRPEESIYDEDMQEELEFEPEEQNGDQESEGVEFDEDDIAHQLRAMEEDGMLPDEQAVENEPDFPMAERQALFQEMLLDCKVDPYSTWDAEVEKIASDPRYLVLDTTKLRKAAFDAYCIEQAQKRAAEKATIHKKPAKQAFLELVVASQARISYWQDFKRKYKKTAEYREYGLTDNEREKLFRSLHEHLKRSQVQREKDFLALLETRPEEIASDPRWHVVGASQRQAIEQVYQDRQR